MQTVLALDLGATTGWCLLGPRMPLRCGVRKFPGDRVQRLHAFQEWLQEFDIWPIDVVAYERPFARGLAATRSLWGMAGIVEGTFGSTAAVLDVHNATIKKWAGRVGADAGKSWSLAKAELLLGDRPLDDNLADAVCLAYYVRDNAEIVDE